MSEIRDWLRILTYFVIALVMLMLVDEWANGGELMRRAIRDFGVFL